MGLGFSKAENEVAKLRGTNRIPSIGGEESINPFTEAWVTAGNDVIKAIPIQAGFVQPVVEKAERGPIV